MNLPVDDFHSLRERLCLHGILTTRTGLRIGSGGSGELDAVDLPVLRDAQRFPLIPGSSIKGVLRSTVESLIRGAGIAQQTGVWACDPLSEGKSSEPPACGYSKAGAPSLVSTDQYCAACRLFGSPRVASHVRVTDALVRTEARRGRIPVELRDGVAIDRDLRVVAGAKKYDFEVVSPGTQFTLEVFVENPQPWLMGLLILGFDQLAEGFSAVGGFTSRGLGRVDIQWSQIKITKAQEIIAGREPQKIGDTAMQGEFVKWRKALAYRAGLSGGE